MSHPEFAHIGTPEDRVIEECAELIFAIQKAKRFGWFKPFNGQTNHGRVVVELADAQAAIDRLCAQMFEPKFIDRVDSE
jgi:hypothetical protein